MSEMRLPISAEALAHLTPVERRRLTVVKRRYAAHADSLTLAEASRLMLIRMLVRRGRISS